MLAEIEIENIALVEYAVLSFAQGLNVLTGETGAGKSLVVDALGFLLGGALRDKPLRQGAECGCVSARFVELSPEVEAKVAELGFGEIYDGELVISRELRASGRSSCRVNSRLASVGAMRQLGAVLVDLHGQHQQYSLMRSAVHLRVLDRYIGAEQLADLEVYVQAHREAQALVHELEELRNGERERLREIDWTAHELGEIEKVAPVVGEDESLEEQIRVLAAAEELERSASESHEILSGEGGVSDVLGRALDLLRSMERKDSRVGLMRERVEEALAASNDTACELSSYGGDLESSPEELDNLQSRQEEISKLKRKYGPTLADVLQYAEKARTKLSDLSAQGERSQDLEASVKAACERRDALARRLSERRHAACERFSAAVGEELVQVGMPHCQLYAALTPLAHCGAEGMDDCEFLIAPNPGEEPKPLAKIASGGELSRIMLALLCLFSKFQAVLTLFFDEIDAGLGGRAAESVARRLKALSQRGQVVCVTHLAIIAAAGANHVHLYKEVRDGRTSTQALVLEGEERELEIARMLSGDASTSEARMHSRGLLELGRS